MRRAAVILLVVIATMAVLPTSGSAGTTSDDAPRVIIDTDLSRWWDDASTIGIANVLHDQGELRLLGIVSDVTNDVAVAALDAINTAYGHPNIPLGAVVGSDEDTFEHGYTDTVIERLPHSVKDSSDVPVGVAVYRRLLAKQPDQSVTIVSLGGFTNLAGLLASKSGQGSKLDGRELVTRKVKRLVQMDGFFPEGGPPFTNQKIDLEAAIAVIDGEGWPTPISWVDGLNGVGTYVGGTLCTTVKPKHPMRIIYEDLFECEAPGDGNWDAPTLLYAIGDLPEIWDELGAGGAAVINDQGGFSWVTPSDRPDDFYIRVNDQAALIQRIDELLVVQ